MWRPRDSCEISDSGREEVDRQDDDRERKKRNKSLSAPNSLFVESFTCEWGRHHRGADGEDEEEEEEEACVGVYTALNHTS